MEAKDFFETLDSMKGKLLPKTYEYCKEMLKEIEEKQRDTDIISCSYEHCGTGKSSLITVILTAYEQFPTRFEEGVIVVTDNLQRLQGLAPKTAEEYNTVNSANKYEIMPKISQKPNLLLTTQRWAMMTTDDIKRLLTYYQNGTKRTRTMVFFDEKPNLYTPVRINEDVLCYIRAALRGGLDDGVPAEHKKFLVDNFHLFHERLTKELEERESKFSTCLYRDPYKTITANSEDDTRFWALIEDYSSDIAKKYQYRKFPLYMRGIKKLLVSGAIYTSHKRKIDGKYEKSFNVGLDARAQFVDIGAKVFVLDATAKVDPLYKQQDFVEYFPRYIERKYDNLKIICHDVNTSKYALFHYHERELTKASARLRETIYQYLSKKYSNPSELAVFTYKNLAPEFENKGYVTGYFGNLKGQNDYRDVQYLAHVGLNRCPDATYFQILQATNPTLFEELAQKHHNEELDRCDTARAAIADICQKAVLADLIQNICRICIRSDSEKQAIVELFYGQKEGQYPNLHNDLKRYFKGASIEQSYEVADKLSYNRIGDRKTSNGKKSNAQRIAEWIDNKENGFVFSVQDLIKAVGITQNQFNDCKRGNAALKRKLSALKIDGTRLYRIA